MSQRVVTDVLCVREMGEEDSTSVADETGPTLKWRSSGRTPISEMVRQEYGTIRGIMARMGCQRTKCRKKQVAPVITSDVVY